MLSSLGQGVSAALRPRLLTAQLPHVHRFRWAGEDAFSPHSLYRCRCGVVKPGL